MSDSAASDFTRPEGFFDLDAATMHARRAAEATLGELLNERGFEEVGLPTLEYADLYLSGGVGSDLQSQLIEARIAEARVFPASGGRSAGAGVPSSDVVLRPDLTTPLCRMHIARVIAGAREGGPPLRRWTAGQVFRNVSPKGGKRKELRQLDAEILGSADPGSDIEILGLAHSAVTGLLGSPTEIRIGHPGLVESLLRAAGIHERRVRSVLGGLDRLARAKHLVSGDVVKRQQYVNDHREFYQRFYDMTKVEPGLSFHTDPRFTRLHRVVEAGLRSTWRSGAPESALDDDQIDAALRVLHGWPSPRALIEHARSVDHPEVDTQIGELSSFLESAEKLTGRGDVTLLPEMSRGFDYYTGCTFEVHARRPAQSAKPTDAGARKWPRHTTLAGGGRYGVEKLARRFAHVASLPGDLPEARLLTGVGFAVLLDSLLEWAHALREETP